MRWFTFRKVRQWERKENVKPQTTLQAPRSSGLDVFFYWGKCSNLLGNKKNSAWNDGNGWKICLVLTCVNSCTWRVGGCLSCPLFSRRTLPETNTSPLKIDLWKMEIPNLETTICRGKFAVRLRECTLPSSFVVAKVRLQEMIWAGRPWHCGSAVQMLVQWENWWKYKDVQTIRTYR